MERNTLSSFNLARLVILSTISKSYNIENDITVGLLPCDLAERISFIMKKYGDKFADIIDKETIINYPDKWAMGFYSSLREAANELRVVYVYDEDVSALKLYCSTAKAEKIIDILNSSNYKDKMDSFVELITSPGLLNQDADQKLGM